MSEPMEGPCWSSCGLKGPWATADPKPELREENCALKGSLSLHPAPGPPRWGGTGSARPRLTRLLPPSRSGHAVCCAALHAGLVPSGSYTAASHEDQTSPWPPNPPNRSSRGRPGRGAGGFQAPVRSRPHDGLDRLGLQAAAPPPAPAHLLCALDAGSCLRATGAWVYLSAARESLAPSKRLPGPRPHPPAGRAQRGSRRRASAGHRGGDRSCDSLPPPAPLRKPGGTPRSHTPTPLQG